MPRIDPIDPADAAPAARTMLEGIQKSLGVTPNLMATLAWSPAALDAYMGLSKSLGRGSLDAKLREQIALAVAGSNGCEYCGAAHATIGGGLGLDADEIAANLRGESADAAAAAALRFARRILETRGRVSDDELRDVRAAGYGNAEITEIVAAVALNVFTNYFNHVAGTEVDFPRVELPAPVAA